MGVASETQEIDALRFIEQLRHFKGRWAGERFDLLGWQRSLLTKAFGELNDEGLRRYRVIYCEVPRKNGKTTLAAGVGLYLVYGDGEPGAEVYAAASDRDQASLVFNASAAMVRVSGLDKHLRVIDSQKRIIHYPSTSFYRAIPSDAAGSFGFDAHGIIFDEFHTQPNRALYDALMTSTGAREQPLAFIITTAGFDSESICREIHDYAMQVRDGVIDDPEFLPVIYCADDDDDWTDPAVWAKANPSLGETVKVEYLAAHCRRALEMPSYQNTFRRLYLNQWTSQETRWLSLKDWDASGGELRAEELKGQICYMGLDLSSTTDISALAMVFPLGDHYRVMWEFWIPESGVIDRGRRDKVPYDAWINRGYIKTTPGEVIDYSFIRRRIIELSQEYTIQEIAFDPWNATQLSTQLAEEDGFTLVETRQGYKTMSPACKELERLILQRRLVHGGNPVARWMADNVVITEDAAGNIKPDKAKASGRIDGIVALAMGLYRATLKFEKPSIYEGRGILTL